MKCKKVSFDSPSISSGACQKMCFKCVPPKQNPSNSEANMNPNGEIVVFRQHLRSALVGRVFVGFIVERIFLFDAFVPASR